MSQHFLLFSSAKTLGIMDILSMSDDDALGLMCKSHWFKTDGEPVCPHCGSEASWRIHARRSWRCKQCNNTYSVTSGTVFDNRKLPLRVYLLAILIFANAAKSLSALQLSRDLKVHYRTAYRLAQVLRESLLANRDESPMRGEVEVDGGYTGTYIRPSNRKEDRIDRRSDELPNKRCVLVMRQRGETGADRTLTEIVFSESASVVTDFVTGGTQVGTIINADENAAYDSLVALYPYGIFQLFLRSIAFDFSPLSFFYPNFLPSSSMATRFAPASSLEQKTAFSVSRTIIPLSKVYA